jgi:DNA-binding GntR family transcriptional regulator
VPVPSAPSSGLIAIGIERSSTVDQVVDALRHAILDGRLAPGEPLKEVSLASGLGVSRGTVREALRVLASDALVRHEAHRGASVARLDWDDAADAYQARIPVEQAAAERVARTGDRLAALRQAVESMAAAAGASDVASFVEAHAMFHATLVGVLGSRRLDRFHASLQAELRLSLATIERMTGSMGETTDDHRRLVDLLAGGDVDAARQAMVDHLRHGAADIAELPGLAPGVSGSGAGPALR